MAASNPPTITFGSAATFSGVRGRLVGMAAVAATDEHRFRFAKSLIAVAAARYQRLAERGTPGFDIRVAPGIPNHMPAWPIPVNLGLPSVPDSEADDNWWHGTWIGILRLLSSQYPKAGLPGTSTVGGGYMQPLGRDDERTIDDVYFSAATWRQLVDDSAIACGLLAALDPEDVEHDPAIQIAATTSLIRASRTEVQSSRSNSRTTGTTGWTADETSANSKQVASTVASQSSLRRLKTSYRQVARLMENPPRGAEWTKCQRNEKTIRRWADAWRDQTGNAKLSKRPSVADIEAMAEWLTEEVANECDVVVPTLRAVARYLRHRNADK
jgi:hypothetical protein